MAKSKFQPTSVNFMSAETVKVFKKAAKAFTRRATRSKEAAIQTLVAEGIYTRTGKPTKNYR